MGIPLTGASNVGRESIVILDEYLAIGSMTGKVRTTVMVDCAVYRTDRHASVNLVYYNQYG